MNPTEEQLWRKAYWQYLKYYMASPHSAINGARLASLEATAFADETVDRFRERAVQFVYNTDAPWPEGDDGIPTPVVEGERNGS